MEKVNLVDGSKRQEYTTWQKSGIIFGVSKLITLNQFQTMVQMRFHSENWTTELPLLRGRVGSDYETLCKDVLILVVDMELKYCCLKLHITEL